MWASGAYVATICTMLVMSQYGRQIHVSTGIQLAKALVYSTIFQSIAFADILSPRAFVNEAGMLEDVDKMGNKRVYEIYQSIHPDQLIHPFHRMKRDRVVEPDPSVLHPMKNISLLHASETPGAQNLKIINMTIHGNESMHFLPLEEYHRLITSINCNDDDGRLSMTFAREDYLETASQAWGWAKGKSETRSLIIIANHPQCGPEEQRQPYLVTDIDTKVENLEVIFNVVPLSWRETAPTFTMEMGSVRAPKGGISRHTPMARHTARSFGSLLRWMRRIGRIIYVGTKWLSWCVDWGIDMFDGNFDRSGNHTIDMTTPARNRRIKTLRSDWWHNFRLAEIRNIDSHIIGNVTITGRVFVERFRIKEIWFELRPVNLMAKLEIEFNVYHPRLRDYGKSIDILPETGIPGFWIPGIVSVGPTISYVIQFELSVWAAVNTTIGVEVVFHNDSYWTMNSNEDAESGFVNGDLTQIRFIHDSNSASVNLDLSAYPDLRLLLGITFFKQYSFGVALGLRLPKIKSATAFIYNKEGEKCGAYDAMVSGWKTGVYCVIEGYFWAGYDHSRNGTAKAGSWTGKAKWNIFRFDRQWTLHQWTWLEICWPHSEKPDSGTNSSSDTTGGLIEGPEIPTISTLNGIDIEVDPVSPEIKGLQDL